MSEVTAREAMIRAEAAHDKIDAHEDLCAERYSYIHEKLDDVKGTVGTVLKLLAGGLSLLFTVLIGLVAFFGSRTFNNSDAEVQQLRDQIVHMQKTAQPAPIATAEIRT